MAGDESVRPESQSSGRLDRLIVENFKTYKGVVVIGPFRDFTAIIGPNGVGKSNIFDALSFVMGIRAGVLRGHQLKDLIYRPSLRDGDAEFFDEIRPKKASVEMWFHERLSKKNAQHSTSDGEVRVIRFQRTISASGGSSYFINGRSTTWEAYNAELLRLGINIKARSFLVMQGDIVSLAQKAPLERTFLFEQLSGSDELREEYEDLRRQKEEAADHTMLSMMKRKGVVAEKKMFKAQQEEAEKFRTLVNQQEDLIKKQMMFELFHNAQDIKDHQRSLLETQKLLKQLAVDKERSDEAIGEQRMKYAQARKSVSSLRKRIETDKQKQDKLRPSRIRIEEQIRHFDGRVRRDVIAVGKLEAEIRTHEQRLRFIQSEISVNDVAIDALETEVKKQRVEELSFSDEDVSEFNALKGEASAQTLSLRGDIHRLEREQKNDESRRSNLAALVEECISHREGLQKQLSQLNERRAQTVKTEEEQRKAIQDIDAQVAELESQRAMLLDRRTECTDLIMSCQEKLRTAKAEKRDRDREIRNRLVLDTLKRLFPGVIGRVVDICRPMQRKYALAVSLTVGKHMDAIVTQTNRTAIDCISYMKDQRLGTMTFLPLDTLKTKPVDARLRSLSAARVLLDVIEYDRKYAAPMHYVCGSTLVCESLADARSLAFGSDMGGGFVGKSGDGLGGGLKVITTDGMVLHKNGSMTGGLSAGARGAAVENRWEESALEELRVKRDRALADLKDVTQRLRRLPEEDSLKHSKGGLEARLQYVEIDRSLIDGRRTRLEGEIEASLQRQAESEPELAMTTERMEVRAVELAKVSGEIARVENTVCGEFCRRLGVPTVASFEEVLVQFNRSSVQRGVSLRSTRARLRSQREYEEHRLSFARKELEQRKEELERSQEVLVTKEKESQEISGRWERLAESVETAAKLHTESQRQFDETDHVLRKLKNGDAQVIRQHSEKSREFSFEEARVDSLLSRRHALYSRCRMEEIDVPLARGSWSAVIASSSTTSESGTRATALREDELEVDFSRAMVREWERGRGNEEERDRMWNEMKAEGHSLVVALAQMDPNLKASDRFKSVKGVLSQLDLSLEASRKDRVDAEERFAAVRRRRAELFNSCFSKAQQAIEGIYSRLTTSEEYPYGGMAYLSVEDTREPFLHGVIYSATPASKRFSDMDSRSGGEKTIAALALVFAMHATAPCPFVLLDEVDAALDPENVVKVVRYLKERSRDGLQVIVVSLKDRFFEEADDLVGVARNRKTDSSEIFTLSLSKFPTVGPAVPSMSTPGRGGGDITARDSGTTVPTPPFASTPSHAADVLPELSLLPEGDSGEDVDADYDQSGPLKRKR